MLQILLTATIMLWTASAFAQGAPNTGLLYHTSEWSSLRYTCQPTRDPDVVTCDMLQVSIMKQADASGLKERIEKGAAQLQTEKPMSEKECNELSELIAKFSGASANLPEKVAKIPADQKRDLVKSFTTLLNHCRRPSAATATEVIRSIRELETRTCLVYANPYSQTFKRVAGSNTWTSNAGPTGPCGIVVASRLQMDNPKYPMLWRYITRKTITNPNGEIPLVGSCSRLDQAEYVYDWDSESKFTKCDYVKFEY